MSEGLAPTTRMAVRAGVVAAAAVLVAHLTFLERSYWVVLTAVLLTYETAGESVQRAAQRLAMTALGCLAGWALYRLAGSVTALRWTVLGSGVFLAVYFRSGPRGAAYAPMTFFVTLYVVFLFAVRGAWTPTLVLARLYDTALGCAVALLASQLVLPQQAGRQLQDDLTRFWGVCQATFESALASVAGTGPAPAPGGRQAMLLQLEQLRTRYQVSVYESVFGQAARRQRDALMAGTESLCRHLLAVAACAGSDPTPGAAEMTQKELQRLAHRMRAGFEALTQSGRPLPPKSSAAEPPTTEVEEKARELLAAGKLAALEFVAFGLVVYHLGEACQALEAILRARAETAAEARRPGG